MNFATLELFRHQGSQENLKKANECSEGQIKGRYSWKRVFRNQIFCFDSQCVAEATTKNFCNKQIKAKKRENQLPCVLALAYRVQLFLHRIIFPVLTLTIKNKAKLFYNQLHLLKEAENWDLNKYIPRFLNVGIY